MAFSVGTLAAYTKDNEDLLVVASVFDAKTQDLIRREGNIMTGVKSTSEINIMDTDAAFQADTSCGFNASGTTSITRRTVTVGAMKVNEQLCPKDLEAKYTQKLLQAGSDYDSIPFEAEYSQRKAAKIAAQLEVAIWQGDTNSADINLNKFDGLIKLINAASGSTVASNASGYIGTVVTGAITTSNVVSVVNSMWRALPARVKGKSDVRIFCGWDVFETAIQAYITANLFHYDFDRTSGEFVIPGTQYKLTAVHGLDSTNRLFACRMSNIFLGVDLLDEDKENRFKMWYSEDDDVVKFKARWKMGVNFAFPAEIVQFTLG